MSYTSFYKAQFDKLQIENHKIKEENEALREQVDVLQAIIRKQRPILPGYTPTEKRELGKIIDHIS